MQEQKSDNIRVVVVEDEEKILANICNKILSLDHSFEIVGKASNGSEGLKKIEEYRPQVVFTDISMPVMDGMELIKKIRQLSATTVIVIISGYSDFAYAQQAIKYSVFNYLLKPLENDALLETLFDIKKNFSYSSIKKERHIMYSENYQLISEQKLKFVIKVICLGNTIYSTQDEEVTEFYSEQVERISWNKVMQKLCKENQWFVADDHSVNQKIIGIKTDEETTYCEETFIQRLYECLKEETNLPVSICSMKDQVEQEEMWNYAKRLRNVIKQSLIVGESQIFYLENAEKSKNDMIEIIKMKLNTYTKNYFISANIENFMNEIRVIFKYMESNNATQDSVEKICIYVLKLLEFSNKDYEQGKLERIQNQVMKCINMSTNKENLFENLMELFRKINSDEEAELEDESNRLVNYIDEHYLNIESVEDVAEKFGYNYAYLSRMFKKKVGESMNRYITNKKIMLAKDMLQNKTDMTVTEISDLCGYSEYRYFSRVFKNEVGVTPSEYRKKGDYF